MARPIRHTMPDNDAIQRHIDRQARGRQQRREKQAECLDDQRLALFGRWCPRYDRLDMILNTCQKKMAERMLEDFHGSGVDEDLEVLKAGWASHFKERPGQPQPNRPRLADLERVGQQDDETDASDESDEPRSVLAAQGERAKQRLKGLEELRRLAQKAPKPYEAMNLSSGFQWNLKSLKAETRRIHNFDSSKSTDPWADWEVRWSQAFRRLEEMEGIRRRRLEESEPRKPHKMFGRAPSGCFEQDSAPKQESKPQPPPRRNAQDLPQKQVREPVPPTKRLESFAEFSTAWSEFEKRLASAGSQPIKTIDIPWPDGLTSVAGITAFDSAADAKKKLRTALLRWHPDKWAPILEQVDQMDKAEVIARVKNVTQRLLEEKKANNGK